MNNERQRERRKELRRKRAIKRRRKMLAGILVALLLLVGGVTCGVRYFLGDKEVAGNYVASEEDKNTGAENDSSAEVGQGLVIEHEEPVAPPRTFTVSLAGDCTMGTDTNYGTSGTFAEQYSLQTPDYFLANVKEVFAEDDLTIVNLEGPLTDSKNKQDKTFAFKGDQEYTQILTDGSVEAVNLANNHSYDYGEEGFQDTQDAVNAAGVTWFGYDETPVVEVNGVQVGLVGIYMLRLTEEQGMEAIDRRIAQAKDGGAEVIIISFHWGIERAYEPNASQVNLAKHAIDQGADLVMGHHPHVLQGIEEYKGKYIVYSLGNFCFGGNKNPSDKDTIIFQQTFTVQNSEVEINDDINIIPCSISSVTNRNNYQPTILSGEAKERVAEKYKGLSMIDITPYIAE